MFQGSGTRKSALFMGYLWFVSDVIYILAIDFMKRARDLVRKKESVSECVSKRTREGQRREGQRDRQRKSRVLIVENLIPRKSLGCHFVSL